MPSSSDLYFTSEDASRDARELGADCQILESDFGHIAGGPGRLRAETREIFGAVERLLAKIR
jgi:homoserine O-acetyltransferase